MVHLIIYYTLMISETKIDNTVSEVQFDVENYSFIYRYDRLSQWRGIPLYVWEDIPSKISTYNFGNIFENLSLRLTSEENSASFLKFLVSWNI